MRVKFSDDDYTQSIRDKIEEWDTDIMVISQDANGMSVFQKEMMAKPDSHRQRFCDRYVRHLEWHLSHKRTGPYYGIQWLSGDKSWFVTDDFLYHCLAMYKPLKLTMPSEEYVPQEESEDEFP